MIRKIGAGLLCLLMIATLAFSLAGCNLSDGNFPVTVGHNKLDNAPDKVVVLSDNIADIACYLGYSTKIAGLSDACTQEELTKYIGSVGSETEPDADKIAATGAKYVLTEKPLSESAESAIEGKGIEVMRFMTPTNAEQLKTLYISLGKFFDGEKDGEKIGDSSFTRITSTLSQVENQVGKSTTVSFCYLYLNSQNELCSTPYNGAMFSQQGYLLSQVCATNVATNFPELKVDEDILKISNPTFIFYDSDEVLNYLEDSSTLHNMSALKNSNTVMLPIERLERQGNTMLDVQKEMLSKMFPESMTAEVTAESLEKHYKIELSEDMKYEEGPGDENVKIIQQRLIDLEYLVLDEGDAPTTYYGSMSTAAVKDFQSKNGLETTGIADYETLKVLFSSTAIGASGKPFVPGTQSSTEPTTEPATESTKPEASGAITPGNYNITFTSETVYKFGDKSEDIKAIQQRLDELKYITFDDGDSYTTLYGPGTERAITQFQEDNGLEATGIADYETLKALFEE